MSLSSAMDIARNNLAVVSTKSSVISRNIANASNPLASRKIVNTATGVNGLGVQITGITRASNDSLFANLLSANSDASRDQAIVNSLDQLNTTINDPDQEASPAALLGKLGDAIQAFSSAPSSQVTAQAAVSAATTMANSLNSATSVVQGVRTDADKAIADSVANVNSLLSQFRDVNLNVINGTRLGIDVTDYLDSRDQILSDLSKEIGIKTVAGQDNDIKIYTDSGVTMFDNTARSVTFTSMPALTPTMTGNAVMVDGVPVTGAGSMPASSGRIMGLAQIRDETTVTYQNQLDEIARGLITTFAEKDQSGASLDDQTGLFRYSGSPTVPTSPPAGNLITGLAGEISVNQDFVTTPTLLRDGGANGAAYVYNTTGAVSYSGRLSGLLDQLNTTQTFDNAAQAGTSAKLSDFASTSVGWLQQMRKSASGALDYSNTVQQRSSDSLSKETGVNLDYEMTILLDLENSFQATSRLIAAIDSMFKALLSVV